MLVSFSCGLYKHNLQLLQAFNAVEEKKITGAEARDIIAAFDKNKDGTIGFEEFVEVRISLMLFRCMLMH